VIALVLAPAGFVPAAHAQQFAPPAQYAAGDGVRILAVADYDGDGAVDILVVDGAGGLALARGDGGGGISEVTAVAGPSLESASDLTSDGRPDLVGIRTDSGAASVLVRVADAAGGFDEVIESAAETSIERSGGFAAADVDGDGHTDVVIAEAVDAGSRLWVASGDGHGTFGAWWPAGETPASEAFLLVADDNGDGRPELAGHDGGQTVWVSPSDPVRGFGAATPHPVGDSETRLGEMVAGAFEHRGREALAVVDTARDCIAILQVGGESRTAPCRPTGPWIVGLAAGDIDGDGLTDLVHGQSGGNVTIMYARRGGLTDPTQVAIPLTHYVSDPRVVDLNGDGRDDVVAVANLRSLVLLRNIGEFQPMPEPRAVEFPDTRIGRTSGSRLVLVRNVGNRSGSMSPATLAGSSAGHFRIAVDLCRGLLLAPGESCGVRVRFAPRATGMHGAVLQWDSGSAPVQLTGVGVCPDDDARADSLPASRISPPADS
jgi:hypothetical protein